jgi:hypothetical protein
MGGLPFGWKGSSGSLFQEKRQARKPLHSPPLPRSRAMIARVLSATPWGVDARAVWIKVDVRDGILRFDLEGLAEASVRETREPEPEIEGWGETGSFGSRFASRSNR